MRGLMQRFQESASKRDFARHYLDYLATLMAKLDCGVIERIIETFLAAGERGSTIHFLGNGGSAATAAHFANDIGFGTRAAGHPPFRVRSLADNLAVVTALGNDEGFSEIFVRQLEGVLRPEDVVVALSVSGNSPNVVRAVEYAREVGAVTIGCTGFDGGKLRGLVDIDLHVPTPKGEYGPVEDIFQVLDHLVYTYLKLHRRGRL